MENDTGSWWLFTGLEWHTNPHSPTLLYTSYADNLQFIKNKSHKDSLKIFLKLAAKYKSNSQSRFLLIVFNYEKTYKYIKQLKY